MTKAAQRHKIVEDENGFGSCLLVRGSWDETIAGYMAKEGIRGLRLSEDAGWTGDNVEFLSELKNDVLLSIEIYSRKVKDVSALMKFRDLKKIGLQTGDARNFTVSRFPKIEYLFLRYGRHGVVDTLPNSLTILKLDNYPGDRIDILPEGKNVTELLLVGKKLSSLDGVEIFPNLKKMTILDAKTLENINGIKKLPEIEQITIHGAKKIEKIDALKNLKLLKTLKLINCSKIQSIESIGNLKNLQSVEISGDTVVADNDLSVLLRLRNLSSAVISLRRSYVPRVSEILSIVRGKT